jgi:transcription antitermination factor NusG
MERGMDPGEFYPGDEVRVIRGTFEGFTGTVCHSDSDTYPRQTGDLVSVMLTIFGQLTPVDVPVEDLELA